MRPTRLRIYFTLLLRYNGGHMKFVIVPVISYLGFFAFLAVLATILGLTIDRIFKTNIIKAVQTRFTPHQDYIVFTSTLIATLASLSLSEILHFQPCVLCWYQRICMYSQVPLLYMGIIRREVKTLRPYLVVLNSLGIIVALYHYSLHVLPRHIVAIAPCSSAVGGVPCDKGYEMFFGFMTFPLMAAAVFALNIFMLTVYSHPSAVPVISKKRVSKKR